MDRGLSALRAFSPVYAEDSLVRVKRYEEGTLSEASETFSATLEYFGEDPQMDTCEFLGILDSFIVSFKDAKGAFEERRRKEERRAVIASSSSSSRAVRVAVDPALPKKIPRGHDENRNPNEMGGTVGGGGGEKQIEEGGGLSLARFLESL